MTPLLKYYTIFEPRVGAGAEGISKVRNRPKRHHNTDPLTFEELQVSLNLGAWFSVEETSWSSCDYLG